jgi:hypothetical protein
VNSKEWKLGSVSFEKNFKQKKESEREKGKDRKGRKETHV